MLPEANFSIIKSIQYHFISKAKHLYLLIMKKPLNFLCLILLSLLFLSSVHAQDLTGNDNDSVLVFASEMPEYPGGQDAMMKFLSKNMHYPPQAIKSGISGTCIYTFVVGSNGVLSGFVLDKSIGYGCNEEALRVLKLMPKWIPGKNDGVPAPVKVTLPIKFQLK